MEAPRTVGEDLVLVRRQHQWSEGGKRPAVIVLVVVACLLPFAPLLLLTGLEVPGETVFRLLGLAIIAALVALLALQLAMARLRCRLIITPTQFRFEAGHRRPIDLFSERSWTYRWDELTFEGVTKSWLHPAVRVLRFRAPDRTLTLNALEWHDPSRENAGDLQRALLKQTFSLGGRKSLGRVGDRAALVRLFAPVQAKVARAAAESEQGAGRSPDNHPAVLAVVALFMALMGYGWVDHFFGFELYRLGGHPWPLIIATGFAAAAIAAVLLRLVVAELEAAKVLAVALLLGISAGLAAIPALNRVSYWSSDGELTAYRYRFEGGSLWTPVAGETPDAVFDLGDYWAHFEVGDEQSFMLLKGGLGYWLIDMAPIYEDQRRYYETSLPGD